MKSVSIVRAIATLLLLLGLPSLAEASVVFSDYVPDNSYNLGFAYVVGELQSDNFSPAGAFTPAANFTLSQIDLSVAYSSGPNSVTLDLLTDSGGAPGTLIESWTLTGLPPFAAAGEFETVTSTGNVALNDGTEYWLRVSAGSNTEARWYANDQGILGLSMTPITVLRSCRQPK